MLTLPQNRGNHVSEDFKCKNVLGQYALELPYWGAALVSSILLNFLS